MSTAPYSAMIGQYYNAIKYLIVRLNYVAPKWSSSCSRVHHLVFTLGQMVHHMGLSNTLMVTYILLLFNV